MLKMYYQDIDKTSHPEIFKLIDTKYKGSIDKYADDLYRKSWFVNKEKVREVLKDFKPENVAKITDDPAYKLYLSINQLKEMVTVEMTRYNEDVTRLQRLYMVA